MIVVVGGIKGGSGKTTLATNLAVIQSKSDGNKLLLVDADEQRSTSDWAQQREGMGLETNWSTIQLSGRAVGPQVVKMSDSFSNVIIDVGGRDTTSQRSALTVADVFLIPFSPRSLDIWTIGQVKELITEIKAVNPKLLCIAVINQADSSGTDNTEAMEVLTESKDLECSPIIIGRRKAFSNAAAEGKGVVELKVQDKKANEEMRKLHHHIYCVKYVDKLLERNAL